MFSTKRTHNLAVVGTARTDSHAALQVWMFMAFTAQSWHRSESQGQLLTEPQIGMSSANTPTM